VSKGGSPKKDGSGNGKLPHQYDLDATGSYKAARQNIEETYPRVRADRLFEWLEAYVCSFPPHEIFAEQLGDQLWSLALNGGVGVPDIDVYFTFDASEVSLKEVFAHPETAG
jgi:hypothetical protein